MTELTRFERARMLGARSLQLSMGAPSMVDTEKERPMEIAKEELKNGKLPITVADN